MFAVPGWSISADTLKTQKTTNPTKITHNAEPNDQDYGLDGGAGKNSKKRKRKRGEDKKNLGSLTVTDENLSDLWKKYIEGKHVKPGAVDGETKLDKGEKRKKRKKAGTDQANAINGSQVPAVTHEPHQDGEETKGREHEAPNRDEDESKVSTTSTKDEIPPENFGPSPQLPDAKLTGKAKYQRRKLLALKQREKKARLEASGALPPSRPNHTNQSTTSKNAEAPPPKPVPSPTISHLPSPVAPQPTLETTALTPLQSQMRLKLIAARFRHLNETLYTTASTHALNLFTKSPASFASYHAGFRAQVSVWPQNPVDTFIADLKARAAVSKSSLFQSQKKQWRDERKGKNKNAKPLPNTPDSTPPFAPLPRSSSGICTIADLGCGDAKLAASLMPHATTQSLRLLSYDLSTGDGPNATLITVADLCQLPLQDGEVDVAVFCLALMGTNWVEGVNEVRRVVRPGGEVWVAEIRSRFQRSAKPDKNRGGQGKDQRKKNHKATNNNNDDEEDDSYANEGEEEDDTEPPPKHEPKTQPKEKEPDIEPRDIDPFLAIWRRRGFTLIGRIDQSNRMFVRMKFIKSPPTATAQSTNNKSRMNPARTNFLDPRPKEGEEEDEEEEDEGKVLKPCVYKIR